MPFTFMPKEYWGGLTGINGPMQIIADALANRWSLEGRMARGIASDPYSWVNPNTATFMAGTPRSIEKQYGPLLRADPLNPSDFTFIGSGAPPEGDWVHPESPEWGNTRGRHAMSEQQNLFADMMQRLFQATGPTQPYDFPYGPDPRPTQGPLRQYKAGGAVKQPTRSQLEDFLELIGIEREGIPAIVHEGEYVLNKEATQQIGKENLDQINNNARNIPRLQIGGGVSSTMQQQSFQQAGPTGRAPTEYDKVAEEWENTMKSPQQIAEDTGIDYNRVLEILDELRATDTGSSSPYSRRRVIPGRQSNVGNADVAGLAQALANQRPMAPAPWEMRRDENPHQRNFESPAGPRGVSPIPQSSWPRNQGGATRGWGRGPIPYPPEYTYRRPEARGGKQSQPEPPPTPTPPTPEVRPTPEVGGGEKKQQSGPLAMPGPQQRQQQITGRAHTQMPNIDWEQLAQMPAGEAMAMIQQYAQTQSMGPVSNLQAAMRGSGPPQMGFQEQLLQQYSNVQGAEGQRLQNQLSRRTMDDKVKLAKLQLKQLSAQSPYFKDLAKLEVDNRYADYILKLAQSEAAARNRTMNLFNMDPSDMISMAQQGLDYNRDLVNTHQQSAEDALQLYRTIPESNREERERAYKAYLRKQLLVDLLRAPNVYEVTYESIQMPKEEVRPAGERGLLSVFGDKTIAEGLTEEEFDRIRSEAIMIRDQMNQMDMMINQFTGIMTPGMPRSPQGYNEKAAEMQAGNP